MKKFLPYILIIILVVLTSLPVSFVHAQYGIDDPGKCNLQDSSYKTTVKNKLTVDQCTNLVNDDPTIINAFWVSDVTPTRKILLKTAKPGSPPPVKEIVPQGSYIFLQPLPCEKGSSAGCVEDKNNPGHYILKSFDPTVASCDKNNKLSQYLNIIIKLIIGLCAVAAMVMIVVGGVEYMMSELISGKQAAKDRIVSALLGLVLALGAYTILFTINPDLLKGDIDLGCDSSSAPAALSVETVSSNIDTSDIPDIKSFHFSKAYTGLEPTYCPRDASAFFEMLVPTAWAQGGGGESTRDIPCKQKIEDVCAYARDAEQDTGTRASSMLGIMSVETNLGGLFEPNSITPWCTTKDVTKLRMERNREHYTLENLKSDLTKILNQLPDKGPDGQVDTIGMSCAAGSGSGGAIGYTQFLPKTWLDQTNKNQDLIQRKFGKAMLDPWNPKEAIFMTGLYLNELKKTKGSDLAAYCAYYGGCGNKTLVNCDGPKKPKITYGDCLLKAVAQMEKQCPSSLEGNGSGHTGATGKDNGNATGNDNSSGEWASNITCNSATVTANVNAGTYNKPISVWFAWGPGYNLKNKTEVKNITGSGKVSFELTGLSSSAIYNIQPRISTIGASLSGITRTFITLSCS